MLDGATLTLEQINEDRNFGIRVIPAIRNPGCDLNVYAPAVEEMVGSGIRDIVDCYTSSSRKEVIPVFEKRDALFWYPTHQEGIESSANVIYTSAAPDPYLINSTSTLEAASRRPPLRFVS